MYHFEIMGYVSIIVILSMLSLFGISTVSLVYEIEQQTFACNWMMYPQKVTFLY